MRQIVVGRQTGQTVRVRGPGKAEWWLEFERCTSGYARVRIECADGFAVDIPRGQEGNAKRFSCSPSAGLARAKARIVELERQVKSLLSKKAEDRT